MAPWWSSVIVGEASAIFSDLIESTAFEQLVDAKQKAGLRAGMDLSARDYLNAMRIRVQIQDAFRARQDTWRNLDIPVLCARLLAGDAHARCARLLAATLSHRRVGRSGDARHDGRGRTRAGSPEASRFFPR